MDDLMRDSGWFYDNVFLAPPDYELRDDDEQEETEEEDYEDFDVMEGDDDSY